MTLQRMLRPKMASWFSVSLWGSNDATHCHKCHILWLGKSRDTWRQESNFARHQVYSLKLRLSGKTHVLTLHNFPFWLGAFMLLHQGLVIYMASVLSGEKNYHILRISAGYGLEVTLDYVIGETASRAPPFMLALAFQLRKVTSSVQRH